MKLGISDKGLRRLARSLQGMPFLADPPISETYKGIEEFPGFHTTENFDMAATYANGRIYSSMTDQDSNGIGFVTDYPVVVQLDMSGFEAQTDYDAEEIVKDTLKQHLQELIDSYGLSEESSDEEITDAAYDFTEGSDYQSDENLDYSNPEDVIFNMNFSQFHDTLPAIMDEPGFPDMIRSFISTGEIPPEILMKATDQYRYTEDIPEEQVTAIWYVKPIATEILTFDNEDEHEEIEARWPGFVVYHEDDLIGGFDAQYDSELVYGSSQEGGQYHGTTYKRLLQAAPGLAGQLPAPPSPPYHG